MRLFKNNLSVVYPEALFLSSSSNEDCTDGDISVMGANLANEVKTYISEWAPGNLLGRLSFIGHSLGGVIIRTALPHLSDFKEKMYTFFTLSSPHLGYMHNNNKIIINMDSQFTLNIKDKAIQRAYLLKRNRHITFISLGILTARMIIIIGFILQ